MRPIFSKSKQSLARFLSGKMSREEEQDFLHRKPVTMRMRQEWNLPDDGVSEGNERRIWQHIIAKIHATRHRRMLVRTVASLAASVLLLLGIGYLWRLSKEPTNGEPGLLVYETPSRERLQLILPDSTIVWLNAGSRIEYSENFKERRFVCLEGEAYFQVVHHASQPFTVHTAGLDVIVLGTVFNVTAYQNETETVTTLVEGTVALQPTGDMLNRTVLTSNRQAVFNRESQQMALASVDPELFTSWVKGYYKFENASFEQIAKYFERVHGNVIRFENETTKKLLFSGTFLQDQQIETALELLQKIRDFRYTVKDEEIIIKQ